MCAGQRGKEPEWRSRISVISSSLWKEAMTQATQSTALLLTCNKCARWWMVSSMWPMQSLEEVKVFSICSFYSSVTIVLPHACCVVAWLNKITEQLCIKYHILNRWGWVWGGSDPCCSELRLGLHNQASVGALMCLQGRNWNRQHHQPTYKCQQKQDQMSNCLCWHGKKTWSAPTG